MREKNFSTKTRAFVFWLIMLSLLGACSTTPEPSPLRAEKSLPDYVNLDGSIRHDVEDQRVADLWRKSETERQQGQYDSALTFLNNALEIAPQDAVLWSRGAENYLAAGEHSLAENYASKSNFFAGAESRALQYRNWLIIKHAREQRGDLLGARNAQQMVLKYQQ
ncbi:MAG: tetratricopeptide repeat protein [Gammaproteobacteria bacterium]|nr:tetratricopeptide repeat protein [Gammaproteobacteria bacterium]